MASAGGGAAAGGGAGGLGMMMMMMGGPPLGLGLSGTDSLNINDNSSSSLKLSSLELSQRDVMRRALQYQIAQHQAKVEHKVAKFDDLVAALRRDKYKTALDIRTMDLLNDLYNKELAVVSQYEREDNITKDELADCAKQQMDIEAEKRQIADTLEQKHVALEAAQIQRRELRAAVQALLEAHPDFAAEFRTIVRADHNDGDDDSTSMAESDYDPEAPPEEEETIVKPDKCPDELFQSVLALRRKRIANDAVLDDAKSQGALEAANAVLTKREADNKRRIAGAEQRLKASMEERQKLLNCLNVVVPLRCHQIQNLDSNLQLPSEMKSCLVFTNAALRQLEQRKSELFNDTAVINAENKQLEAERNEYKRLLDKKKKKIASKQVDLDDSCMLIFGFVNVNLELLEKIDLADVGREKREELRRAEDKTASDLEKCQSDILAASTELNELTVENTKLLNKVVDLTREIRHMEQILNSTSLLSATHDNSKERKKKELERLRLYVKAQAAEREALTTEIVMLRHKSSQVNVPRAHSRGSSRGGAPRPPSGS